VGFPRRGKRIGCRGRRRGAQGVSCEGAWGPC
jgi:hypothetical protein